MSERRFTLIALLSLAGLTAALYARTLDYEFVIDDHHYIVTNPAVVQGAPFAAYFSDPRTASSDETFQYASWRPVRTLAFRALAKVAGLRPAPWRAANLALYASASVLVLLLARAVTGDRRASLAAALAWTAAPVHVEAAIYLSSIGDQLSLVLQLASLLAGLRALEGRRPAAWVAGSVGLAAVALAAKEMAVTTVALMALLAAARHGFSSLRTRRAGALLGAHAALALAFVMARSAILGAVGHRPISARVVWDGLFASPPLVIDYLRISLALFGHSPTYSDPVYPSTTEVLVTTAALATAILLGVRTRRAGLWLGAAWFVAALLPVLHIIPISATFADRYALVPSVGLALAFAAGLAALPARFQRLALALAGASTVVLAAASWLQEPMWRNRVVLWRTAVDLEPMCGLAHGNLGAVLFHDGQLEESVRELERAAKLGHLLPGLETERALALDALGRRDEAIAVLERGARRFDRFAIGHAVLGALLLARGDLAGARRHLAPARADAPDDPLTLRLTAQIAERDGRMGEAAAVFRRLAADAADSPRLHYEVARTALLAGDPVAAAESARACLSSLGDQPQCSALLGRALVAQGRRDEAREPLTRALSALPEGEERKACAAALASPP
ncbi:MAG: hypothetical protein EXR72_22985 [Myxococcales bacterium]|nr:hypothetical protein [Myxococcales bacterium]